VTARHNLCGGSIVTNRAKRPGYQWLPIVLVAVAATVKEESLSRPARQSW